MGLSMPLWAIILAPFLILASVVIGAFFVVLLAKPGGIIDIFFLWRTKIRVVEKNEGKEGI